MARALKELTGEIVVPVLVVKASRSSVSTSRSWQKRWDSITSSH